LWNSSCKKLAVGGHGHSHIKPMPGCPLWDPLEKGQILCHFCMNGLSFVASRKGHDPETGKWTATCRD